MKAIILLMALISFSAFANCNPEAQFIGTVTDVVYHPQTEARAGYTSFQLKLGRWYAPSMVCPLWEDEFEAAIIEIPGIPLIAEGDEVSGILVYDVETEKFRIE